MAIWKLLSVAVAIRHFPSGRRAGAQFAPRRADIPRTARLHVMDGLSLTSAPGASQAAPDRGSQSLSKKAIGQDEASALALLEALPTPVPAISGMLGTQLDAWA
jgi:hypothetical protein